MTGPGRRARSVAAAAPDQWRRYPPSVGPA
jgi:hypothetical protein